MTGRLLPAAVTAAACIALTGLALSTLGAIAPQHPARTAGPAAGLTALGAPVNTSVASMIRTATQQARQLLRCPAATEPPGRSAPPIAGQATPAPVPAPASKAPSKQLPTSPLQRTCGRLTVLRAETGPDTGGVIIVLLIASLQPDPLVSGGAGSKPIPIALRLQVYRSPAGVLIAKVVGP